MAGVCPEDALGHLQSLHLASFKARSKTQTPWEYFSLQMDWRSLLSQEQRGFLFAYFLHGSSLKFVKLNSLSRKWPFVFRKLTLFPGSSAGKGSACNAGDLGSIPGSGRSAGEGIGYPLQCSCLENPLDRGAWRVTVHAVAKSWTWLSD